MIFTETLSHESSDQQDLTSSALPLNRRAMMPPDDDRRFVNDVELTLFSAPVSQVMRKLAYCRRLEKLWVVLENEYSDPDLKLTMVALECGIAKNHLNVMLRRTIGFTFHQLLTRYRLFKAIAAMRERDFTFLEITLQVGFGSLSSFERSG